MIIIGLALLAVASRSKRSSKVNARGGLNRLMKSIVEAVKPSRGELQSAKRLNGDDEEVSTCMKNEGYSLVDAAQYMTFQKFHGYLGQCCAKYPKAIWCPAEEVCKGLYDNSDEYKKRSEDTKKCNQVFCDTYCDEIKTKPDWCPALSTGAIIGIVIAVVVVVGAAVGAAIFFLVIRKASGD
jgi:hypothetical protein